MLHLLSRPEHQRSLSIFAAWEMEQQEQDQLKGDGGPFSWLLDQEQRGSLSWIPDPDFLHPGSLTRGKNIGSQIQNRNTN